MRLSSNFFYMIGGYLSLFLGFVGIFLPIMPTTPFVILAAYCFARSNQKMRDKLLKHRIFGPLIQDWERHRGIRRSVKIKATLVVTISISCTLYLIKFEAFKSTIILSTIFLTFLYIWTRPEPDNFKDSNTKNQSNIT